MPACIISCNSLLFHTVSLQNQINNDIAARPVFGISPNKFPTAYYGLTALAWDRKSGCGGLEIPHQPVYKIMADICAALQQVPYPRQCMHDKLGKDLLKKCVVKK